MVQNERQAPEGTVLFTPAMVCKSLGISMSYYEQLVQRSRLVASFQSGGKQRRFTESDLDRFRATWKRKIVARVDKNRELARRVLSESKLVAGNNTMEAFQKTFLTYRDLGLNACKDCWMVTSNMIDKATDCGCYEPEGDCKLLAEMRMTWREKIQADNKHLRPTDIPLVQIYVRNLVVAFMCESFLSKRSILISNVGSDREKVRQIRDYLKTTERDIIRLAGILCLTPASRRKVGGGVPSGDEAPKDPFGGE